MPIDPLSPAWAVPDAWRRVRGALRSAGPGADGTPSDTIVTVTHGRRLELDLGDRTQRAMATGAFEPAETRLVRRLLGEARTFVDVGAHVGWFTSLAQVTMPPGGRVWALEAHPRTRSRLVRNVALSGGTDVDVTILAEGASDRVGATTIGFQLGSDSGSATLGSRAAHGRHEVPVRPLDEILDDAVEPDLLKIDVEGWEARVLRGATRVLARTRRALVEINPSALRANASTPDEILGLLRDAGFASFHDVGRPVGWYLRRGNARVFRNVLAQRGEP